MEEETSGSAMLKRILALRDTNDEEKLLNIYTMIGWGGIVGILAFSYAFEVIKDAFEIQYYLLFMLVTVVPYLVCLYRSTREKYKSSLRKWIFVCYFFMYIFVLVTGHTHLVFTYIFPILTFLILYHDPKLILRVGKLTLATNVVFIYRDYCEGKITKINSREYEIQIALIIICFTGCYLAARVYERINKIKDANEEKVKDLLMKQTILEAEKRMAYVDYLTGLANRKKYDEALDELAKADFKPFYLIAIDINGLKKCNDTFGHLAGDELIIGMAQCITEAFSERDSESFRLGGDEFGVISHCNEQVFNANLERMRENISNWKGEYGYKLDASIGYVFIAQIMETRDMTRLADEEMYKEKEKFYADSKNVRRTK